ncbi:tetratricopeptide repeat protein [Luteirhabdus pelagi]|uniref:tetratricopeptide repeat protein n=1 Tax=Luteirhabdus pelagi TaxID=2792783 RepID=UPI0019398DDA|nr:tetratricopeptide repeat protein [Luteirhabdus pelagi]
MKSRTLVILIVFIFLSHQNIAQSNISTLIEEGIGYHDKGEYDKAIKTYKNALKLDPKATIVHYEIALSYFKKGDFKKAIKHSDMVLEKNRDYMLEAYMMKGSALDMIGKTQESILLFEKAIETMKPSYLLYYNLALNYYKINDLENAEANVLMAIEINSNHSSSHLMLANIHHQKKNTVQSLLATHYFLFLEPNTSRSKEAYRMLKENFGGNVSKDPEKPNSINISLTPNSDRQFGAAEMMISMLEASRHLEKNEGKSDDELFVENTASFFNLMDELKKRKSQGIWWTFYTPFFHDLTESDHFNTYCKYITQSSNEASQEWLLANEEKLIAFDEWLRNQ